MLSGYWQIKLAPESKKYMAFSTPDGGHYKWKVMGFGLKRSPGEYNSFITEEVLCGYIGLSVRTYLNDFIIYSNDWLEHLYHLQLVLERLQLYDLTCSLGKCCFGIQKLKFLGHIITPEGNSTPREYIRAITEAEEHRNRRELHWFLGICGWLREYIPQFTMTAIPLTALLSEKRPRKWGTNQKGAFDALKQAFSQPLELSRPVYSSLHIAD